MPIAAGVEEKRLRHETGKRALRRAQGGAVLRIARRVCLICFGRLIIVEIPPLLSY